MTTLIPERLAQIDTIKLDRGAHQSCEDGMCFIEFADWLAGGLGRDDSKFVSPVIRSFGINLNDTWGDEDRQRLRPFGPRIIGTGGDGKDETRSYLAFDWLIRTYTPAFLDLANLSEEAQALRDLRRIVDLASAEAAGPVVRAGREKARAAGDAAWDAAWAAARAAAWDAAGDAAWAAARAAAWDAARAAARAAAGAAARDALKPTVDSLKASALELLDSMIDPEASK